MVAKTNPPLKFGAALDGLGAGVSRFDHDADDQAARLRALASGSKARMLEPVAVKGRPAVGKRSDPQYKLYSHLLKKTTQRAVSARLRAVEDGPDFSDLLEQLLSDWLKRDAA